MGGHAEARPRQASARASNAPPPAHCAVTASASCHHPVTRVCCLTLPTLQLPQHGHAPHVQRGRHELVLLPRGALAATLCRKFAQPHTSKGHAPLSLEDQSPTRCCHPFYIHLSRQHLGSACGASSLSFLVVSGCFRFKLEVF